MGHISPTTLRIEVVEILFFEVTRNLKDQVLKFRKRKYMLKKMYITSWHNRILVQTPHKHMRAAHIRIRNRFLQFRPWRYQRGARRELREQGWTGRGWWRSGWRWRWRWGWWRRSCRLWCTRAWHLLPLQRGRRIRRWRKEQRSRFSTSFLRICGGFGGVVLVRRFFKILEYNSRRSVKY